MRRLEIILLISSCGACFLCSISPYIVGYFIQGSDLPGGDFANVVGLVYIFILGFVPLMWGLIGLSTGLILLYRNRNLILSNYHPFVFSFAIILCLIIGVAFAVISFEIISLTDKLIFGGESIGLLEYIELIIDLLL